MTFVDRFYLLNAPTFLATKVRTLKNLSTKKPIYRKIGYDKRQYTTQARQTEITQ
jgi:hypothetical protein